jgi:hypothetical protein
MTAIVLCVSGIILTTAGFFALAWWGIGYFTRDTGTHAAPRHRRGSWDRPPPLPADWLPAAPAWPPPEVAHEEDWRESLTAWHDALDERHSGVIVANVYHPTPAGPPLDYEPDGPFTDWLRDSFVGGIPAIAAAPVTTVNRHRRLPPRAPNGQFTRAAPGGA